MKRPLSYFTICILCILSTGCGKLGLYNAKSTEIVASVGNLHLYESDLSSIFTSYVSDSDSISIRKQFVDEWIKTQVLQKIASSEIFENSSADLNEIERKVELYRRQLILYQFETSFIESNLDTTVDNSAISDYYRGHLSSFKLSSPLIKGAVARIPSGVRQARKLENLFISKDEEDVSEFLEICDKNNYLSFNYVDNWVDISEIAKVVPFQINKADELFSSRRFYDVEDDNWHYMLRIDDYLPSGSIVPLDREMNNIKKILLHERRNKLKSQLEDSLVNYAVNSGMVVIK